MTATLRVHMLASPVHTLGPFARYGIWVQGCCRACAGCISPEAQPMHGGYDMTVRELAGLVAADCGVEGLTISGGEPFLQADALCELIRAVRRLTPLGVILYTGFRYEEIVDEPLTALCDALIDGPYEAGLDDGLSLRGSSNQRLILRTPRYEGLISFGQLGRPTEYIVPHGGGLSQVGVPSRAALRQAQALRTFWEKENGKHEC